MPKFNTGKDNRIDFTQILKHLSGLSSNQHQCLYIRRITGLGDVLMAALCASVLKTKNLGKFDVGLISDASLVDVIKRCNFVNQVCSDQNFSGFFSLNLQNQIDYLPDCIKDSRIDLMGRAVGLTESEIPHQFPVLSRSQWTAYSHKWQSFFVGSTPVIGLVPLAFAKIRSWPNWRKFVALGLKNNLKFVVLHNRKLKTVSDHRVLNITGRTSSVEYMSILSACDAVVSVDTSAIHVCGFLGVPTLTLFGPIDPTLRVCYYQNMQTIWLNDQFECCPCFDWQTECCEKTPFFRGCMKNITAQMVLDKLSFLIQDLASKKP